MAKHQEKTESGRSENSEAVSQPWQQSAQQVLEELDVDFESGLEDHSVKKRRDRYGRNQLSQAKKTSPWEILFRQVKSLIVIILSIAAVTSFAFGKWMDGSAIAMVIVINTLIGFFMELKAVRSMESLRKMEKVTARLRRSGDVKQVPARQLVPGDIILVEGGDIVSADARLVRASKLSVDESALTGESVPVAKSVDAVEGRTPLSERRNMLFKGTALTRGSGEAVVTAIGTQTELGAISEMVEQAEDVVTPLEKRLDQLGRKLLWLTLAIIIVISLAGIWRGKEVVLMIETAIALAIAAIPEGLPIVATLALARGMIRMARRNALVNQLGSVETLGATGVICTDKTGTLTENRMTVTDMALESGTVRADDQQNSPDRDFTRDGQALDMQEEPLAREMLEIGALCNNAGLSDEEDDDSGPTGDPLEVALLAAARKAGINRDDLVKDLPEKREEAFDSDTKMMATYHEDDGRYRVAVKGAPEAVLDVCSRIKTADGVSEMGRSRKERWLQRNEEMADEGLRVLAVATRDVDDIDADPYEDLSFVGLFGMEDPPREDVKEAIDACRSAGIKVVMVTGDHPRTARSIAEALNLGNDSGQVIMGREIVGPDDVSDRDRGRFIEASIFARVSPRQKLDLIDLHQQTGSIVAMTGDGVNDAPALKKADIGVAMGGRGTQVAREASDMILKDDAFRTIVVAVRQGRIIFENIRKFVMYLLSGNASELLVVFLASLLGWPLPLLPLQILFLNIVNDVFPALALGIGPGSEDVMAQKPRHPDAPVLEKRHWWAIFAYGGLIMVPVTAAFRLAMGPMEMSEEKAVTVSFLTLAFARLWHIVNMRRTSSALIRNEITANIYVWAALVFCTCLLAGAVYLPGLSTALSLFGPGVAGWVLILSLSLVPLVVGQIVKAAMRYKSGPHDA